jgi:hypothetical protein
MSNPEPMPVEVIKALALAGELLLLGGMTELMDVVRVTLANLSATSRQT